MSKQEQCAPDEVLCALCKAPYRVGMSAVCYGCGHAHGSAIAEPALHDELAASERKVAWLAALVVASVLFFVAEDWLESFLDARGVLSTVLWLLEPLAVLLAVSTIGLSANKWRRYRALKRSGR